MAVREYGCNYCRIIFNAPEADNVKDKGKVTCPSCGSTEVEKFESYADKVEFARRFVFTGG